TGGCRVGSDADRPSSFHASSPCRLRSQASNSGAAARLPPCHVAAAPLTSTIGSVAIRTRSSADRLHSIREDRQPLVYFGIGDRQWRQQLDDLILWACGFHQQSALEGGGGHLPGQLTMVEDQAVRQATAA